MNTIVVLVDEQVRDETRRNLLLSHHFGAELHYAGVHWKAYALGAWNLLRHISVPPLRMPQFIMPGGSTNKGILGYVSAALELETQVHAGELPEPDYIFVAVGTNGTMAGLEAGLLLTNLKSKLIGVCVSDEVEISNRAVAKLANQALSLLVRHDSDIATAGRLHATDITIWHDYLGPGYAQPTPMADEALRIMAEQEGFELEFVYTGKTLAALMGAVGRPDFQDKHILFWNTFNSMPFSDVSLHDIDYKQLPPALHQFFE